MIREVVADVLLGLAVLTVAMSAVGVLTAPDAYARLHYVTPAAVVAPVLVALAVFVTEGLDENTGETVVALAFMIAAAPVPVARDDPGDSRSRDRRLERPSAG